MLARLSSWVSNPNVSDRVVALIAAGGTGKTALAERVLAQIPENGSFGVFVWSFYENQRTESFLQMAYEYFVEEEKSDSSNVLHKLLKGLSESRIPHLFIIDGLELIQNPGTNNRWRGVLEDPQIKHLLRHLASGQGAKTKALITSRFQLPDLEPWLNKGFSPINLEDLDTLAARQVLRKRGVKGTNAEIDDIARSVHAHALTLDVLGIFLHRFGDDNPKSAADFAFHAVKNNHKGAKLLKVLNTYAEKLPTPERDVLSRISIFPRGVTAETLVMLSKQTGDLSGSLSGLPRNEIIDILYRLEETGLIFKFKDRLNQYYTAHPFLRDFFRGLLDGSVPQRVHEEVRKSMLITLEGRPGDLPRKLEELDFYERFFEVTQSANQSALALDVYKTRMGGYGHLGADLGDFNRGLRMLSSFLSGFGVPPTTEPIARARTKATTTINTELDQSNLLYVLNELMLYSLSINHVESTIQLLEFAVAVAEKDTTLRYTNRPGAISTFYQFLSRALYFAGRFPASLEASKKASSAAGLQVQYMSGDMQGSPLYPSYHSVFSYRLTMLAKNSMGDLQWDDIKGSLKIPPRMLLVDSVKNYGMLHQFNDELTLRNGNASDVLGLLQNESHDVFDSSRSEAVYFALRGEMLIDSSPQRAADYLSRARAISFTSEPIEVNLRCHHLAAIIACRSNNYSAAIWESENGLRISESFGFGLWSLEFRLGLANANLLAGNLESAISNALRVLERSRKSDCHYAWGIAESSFILGIACSHLGDKSSARNHFQRCIEYRAFLKESRKEEIILKLDELTI